MSSWSPRSAVLLNLLGLCCSLVFAQDRAILPGHMHPGAITANDMGRVDASLTLQHVSIFLRPSQAQQADLTSFLAQQQDPNSPNYHRWLTPEQYADRFGASQQDAARVVAWLKKENLRVIEVARGRNLISFTGAVRDVEHAFGTEIHNYAVDGEAHFANATDPSVPMNLGNIVMAIHGLNDFRMKPFVRVKGRLPNPTYTSGASGSIFVAPDDLATIYDVKPLLNSGINGAGLKIAVVGQTDINLSDIEAYHAFFNLPATDPQLILVPGSKDPGILSTTGDLGEADLDIELSGAIARAATILFVYSNNVEDSLEYAIEENLAPVLSMSYGECESATGNANLKAQQALAEQANAQGMTWIAASGDDGAAGCYTGSGQGNADATLAVSAPASIPEVTGMGGTEFNEGSGTYWSGANDTNHASALSYIPEIVWNDSLADGSPSASSGGASSFFAKPTWQTGTGVPTDGARDVPDLALAASDDHDLIMIYTGGSLELVGGTSCAAPAFAGMATLLNQYLVVNGFQKTAGLGNINPRLYALATSPGVFHDITVGNNTVNGCIGVRNCTASPVGYSATVGYDQASGLGSVDLFNFATAWPQTSTTSKSAVTVTLTSSATTLLSTASVTLTATVTLANPGTPTGTVTFYAAGVSLGSATLSGATAAFALRGSAQSPGLLSVSAEYSGDINYAAAAGSLSLTVVSTTVMAIQGIVNAASGNQAFSPGTIISIYGSLLAGSTLSATTVPLPTSLGGVTVSIAGTPAPIYFVSPDQLNIQIPFSIPTNAGVETIAVTWNGTTVTAETPLDSASPGIFVDYTTGAPAGIQTAAPGQEIAIYVTGAGAVLPAVVSGSTPSGTTTPIPTLPVTVSVGGVIASTSYAYIGVPVWAIGLIQINFTVPTSAPLGSQPLLVMIDLAPSGDTPEYVISAAANIMVTE